MNDDWLSPPHALPSGSILLNSAKPSTWRQRVPGVVVTATVVNGCRRTFEAQVGDVEAEVARTLHSRDLAFQWEDAARRVREALVALEIDNERLDCEPFLRFFKQKAAEAEVEIGEELWLMATVIALRR